MENAPLVPAAWQKVQTRGSVRQSLSQSSGPQAIRWLWREKRLSVARRCAHDFIQMWQETAPRFSRYFW